MFSLGRKAGPGSEAGALLEWVLDKDREVVYSLGTDRRFRMVKGATGRLWGYRNEELLGRDFVDLVVPPERRIALAAFNGHLRGRVTGIQESNFQKRDGSAIRMVWKLSDGPRDGAILGEAREYAVRRPRAASQAWSLVAAEAYQRALDEHAVVSLADAQGRILAVNDRFCELTGYGREDLVGQDYRMVRSGHHPAAFFTELWATLLAGRVWKGEICNRTRRGDLYWVATTLVPVPDPAGIPSFFIAIQTDLTAVKATEEALRQSQKLEGLKAFAGGAAHDFSNLLTAILGNCHLGLQEVPEAGRARAALERIEKAAGRGADLTSQLLAYLGQAAAARRPVALNPLVLSARDLLETMLPADAQLELGLGTEEPTVLGDSGQLLQVLRTLAANACEALVPGCPGQVRVRTGVELLEAAWASPLAPGLDVPAGSYGFLEVRDDGAGMTHEVLRKAFDPFFTTKFIGRGLGLPALAGIVRNHGGTVRLDSEPGRGTAVRVLVPLQS